MSKKSKHTPGPWKTRKGFNWGEIDIFAPNPKIKKPFQPTELAIVRLVGTQAEYEANARLIAAAPELLACCKEFIRRVDTGEFSWRLFKDIKSAIAKAEGN